ncbi:hypothetical protein HZS_3138 [Henneguya salminicola]|nr:hypothetical protein HZS_3138 [Henneguya salminicola]
MEWKQSDICKFTGKFFAQDNSISVLIGSTIKFILFKDNWKQGLIDLPIYLSHVGNIKRYIVNLNLRCLYKYFCLIIHYSECDWINPPMRSFITTEQIFL